MTLPILGGSPSRPVHDDRRRGRRSRVERRCEVEVVQGTRPQGRWTVVEVAGELDLHTSPALRDQVLGLIEEGTGFLAIDLTKVDFMDSSSLGSLVACLKRLREHDGRLVLIGVTGSPKKVLGLTGLDRVFEQVERPDELPAD